MFYKKKRYINIGIATLVIVGIIIFIKLLFFSQPSCKNCNVILISLDTLSANHLPCYGYGRNTAPNLCKFGKENIMFENMYANSSYTLPSHVSIFTGLYPSQHKVNIIRKDALSPNITFLPEVLQKNGYNTYFYMGYQTYYNTPPYNPLLPIDKVYSRGINEVHNAYNTSDWDEGLQKLKENDNKGKKTFLFLHTYWIHKPYLFTENEKRQFINKQHEDQNNLSVKEGGCSKADDFIPYLETALKHDLDSHYWDEDIFVNGEYKQMNEYLLSANEKNETMCSKINANWYWREILEWYYYSFDNRKLDSASKKDRLAYMTNLYDSKIFELDTQLKTIFSFVEESNLKENTIIIVTADHGEEFLEHGQFGHEKNLYDTITKVPLMMYIPGQKKQTNNRLVQSVDLFPTIINLVGVKQSFRLSGKDFFTFNLTPEYAISEQLYEGDITKTIRNLDWKLILRQGIPVELYNYSKDHGEKINLIQKEKKMQNRFMNELNRILSK